MLFTKNIKGTIPVYYDDEYGWIVYLKESIPNQWLKPIADYVFKINYDRWLSMPHGERRDRVGKALKELKEGKIQQVIEVGPHGMVSEGNIFKSSERRHPERMIMDLGG